MKRPDPGMHRDAFRQALTGKPDANRIGMSMLLNNDPNTYPGKGTKARRTTKRKRTRR